ncbi:1-phosphatidylinositol 4-kinase [Handroanthus impetiginosus]|uniref:1-phosphatidylinositol 4-kinase n=1 Tax=Handroanthus impetiginosus TaxID=429701 RepID=A0A2G9HBT5_9LAMI|nr:1-phosphatidylinositol 4-kinase [Handroanthus impetiginosus]
MLSPKAGSNFDEFQFEIDCEESGDEFVLKSTSEDLMAGICSHLGFGSINSRTPLSKLDESIEEEESEGEEENGLISDPSLDKSPSISKLSMSLKNTSLGEKNHKFPKFSATKSDYGCLASSSSGHRSANEQLPASVSFVKLADMNEEEWGLFLDKFRELITPAFMSRKSAAISQRQRQRLGTSCKF